MCDFGVTAYIALAGLALSAASVASSAVISEKQADNQERIQKAEFKLKTQQINAAAAEAAEEAAEQRAVLAEEAARARGEVQSAGLGAASLRSFLTDVSRKQGRSNAIIDRNLDLVGRQQTAKLQGAELEKHGALLSIDANRPHAATIGLQLGGAGVSAYGQYEDNKINRAQSKAQTDYYNRQK